jgi:biopolymer transport protein ExbB
VAARRGLLAGATLDEALQACAGFDREQLVQPLVAATHPLRKRGTLAGAGDRSQQLTRVLRDALHACLGKLQFGQVLLATVGATAPFVGLLGTVWGIYHALTASAGAGRSPSTRCRRPGGRGADHDGRRPGGGHSGGAGLQRALAA